MAVEERIVEDEEMAESADFYECIPDVVDAAGTLSDYQQWPLFRRKIKIWWIATYNNIYKVL
jgi:hypothetical protein